MIGYDLPGTFIPDHLTRAEHHSMSLTIIVQYVQVPVPSNWLTNVQNSWDHMGGEPGIKWSNLDFLQFSLLPINVWNEPWSISVPPDAISRSML